MKILIVHPHIFGGGAEHQVLYLAEYLNRNHEVAIATLSLQDNLPDFCKGLNIVIPEKPVRSPLGDQRIQRYLYNANTALKLRRLVKSEMSKYDILNPHNFPATLSCMKQAKKSTVWYSQGDSPGFFVDDMKHSPISNTLNDFFLYTDKFLVRKYISQICTGSKLAARMIERRYLKPVQVVYPAVDYEYYSKGNAQTAVEKYGLHDSFVLLQVARVDSQKNQMATILALEKLVDRIPNVRLVIAGGGENPYSLELKTYLRLKGLQKYVTFTGYIQSEEVRDLYHACHINMLPAHLESFGMTPMEGLCASKIPIVSPGCGVAEFVAEHNIGLVSEDLVSSISDIYEKYRFYQGIALRGKRIVKELLSRDMFGKNLETIFSKYTQ